MNKIAIIPARSGSKGLPNKNILNLCGKPMIAWTIESAIKSKKFARIIVTTDSEQYGVLSQQYGAEVIYRSKELSDSNASTYDVIQDLLKKIDIENIDYFMLLQPTSPLRNERHIEEAINLFEENFEKFDTLVSVKKASKSSDLIQPIDSSMSLKSFDKDFSKYKRQQCIEYEPNGAIFISKIESYLKVKHFFGEQGIAYIMDNESSIDIDDKLDFELANIVLLNKNKEQKDSEIVINRIKEKKILENKINNEITLIGHSFFDEWDIKEICKKTVNNLGISKITALAFENEVLNKLKTDYIGKNILVMFGANEIIYEKNIENIINEINCCILKIRSFNSNKIFFINMTNVNGYIDRDNTFINMCKEKFKELIKADKIISMDALNDKFGCLNNDFTNDRVAFK